MMPKRDASSTDTSMTAIVLSAFFFLWLSSMAE